MMEKEEVKTIGIIMFNYGKNNVDKDFDYLFEEVWKTTKKRKS